MATVLSNEHVLWAAGPDSAISDAHWVAGPTLAEAQSLTNITAGLKIDGTDFGVQASDSVEDRSFADGAGAQSRGFAQASGSLEAYTPGKGDSGIYSTTWDIVAQTRTTLALLQRVVPAQSTALAAGDEINVFRVETDDRQHNRNDASRTIGIGLVLQDNILVNYIIPSSTPTAVTVTPAGPIAATVGTPKFLKAAYQGRNVTTGALWTSSDEGVFKVTPHGIIIPVAAGTANLNVSVPGSAAGSDIAVTVSAA